MTISACLSSLSRNAALLDEIALGSDQEYGYGYVGVGVGFSINLLHPMVNLLQCPTIRHVKGNRKSVCASIIGNGAAEFGRSLPHLESHRLVIDLGITQGKVLLFLSCVAGKCARFQARKQCRLSHTLITDDKKSETARVAIRRDRHPEGEEEEEGKKKRG